MQRYNFLIIFIAWVLVACQPPAAPTAVEVAPPSSTFILVRHAEKDAGDDPTLTPQGSERALRLASMLDSMQIDAIYASDFRRTRLTAAPLARAKGLDVQSYNPKEIVAVAAALKAKHAGQTVVVVGHSNTTPQLAALLENTTPYPDFDESDYGNVLVVTTVGQARGRLLRLRF